MFKDLVGECVRELWDITQLRRDSFDIVIARKAAWCALCKHRFVVLFFLQISCHAFAADQTLLIFTLLQHLNLACFDALSVCSVVSKTPEDWMAFFARLEDDERKG